MPDVFFESAVATLESSLSEVNPPPDHPVRSYIRLAQMRTLRAWRFAEYPNRPADLQERQKWNEEWNRKYNGYRKALEPLMEANRGLKAQVEKMDSDYGYTP